MKYEKGAFITIPNKQLLRTVSIGARAVFIEICDFADEYGKCFPSRKKIAENIKMHTDSVDRFIDELIEAKMLKKSGRTRKDGSRTSNEYQILLVPLGTHTEGGIGTHHEAELYPVLTETTYSFPTEKYEDFRIVEEPETKKPRKRVDTHILDVFRLVGGSKYPKPWERIPAYRESADWLFSEKGTEQIAKAIKIIREHKGTPDLPTIHTPYDLFTKWEKLIDFKERHGL